MKTVFLSYPLTPETPVYGSREKPRLEIRRMKSIDRGDSSNTFRIAMENHWGTHVDAPSHFFSRVQTILDYPADFWKFNRPQAVNVRLAAGELLSKNELDGKIKGTTDLLLLKSGWGNRRDTEIYAIENPGIDPEIGAWLRAHYPNIRAMGFDWISLSSYKWREKGREAHRAFLDPGASGHPILVIEDMDLSEDLQTLEQATVLPLRVSEIDSAPCTILGMLA